MLAIVNVPGLARRLEHVGEAVVGRCSAHDDQGRRRRQLANRPEARQRIVVYLAQVRIDEEGIGGEQERIAIRRRACRRFRADDLARPRPIVDQDGCALRSPNLIPEQTRQNVGRTTRRGRNDELERSLRLRGCAMSCKGNANASDRGSACGQMWKSKARKFHCSLNSSRTIRTAQDGHVPCSSAIELYLCCLS